MILPSYFHKPVLLPEIITNLNIVENHKYIDATAGGGGYIQEILKRGGRVLGIDADKDAINYLKKRFAHRRGLILRHGNFAHLKAIAQKEDFNNAAGIIFDLGISSYQIKNSGRGFSYLKDELLDMRYDTSGKIRAIDIINNYPQENLYEIFAANSEELNSRSIAAAVFSSRLKGQQINTSGELVQIIGKKLQDLYPGISDFRFQEIKKRCIRRVFQALRIEVNNELDCLKQGLIQAVELLGTRGRCLVISYHSLEDRLVKLRFRQLSKEGRIKIISKKPVIASREEVKVNSSSSPAKLRILEKIDS